MKSSSLNFKSNVDSNHFFVLTDEVGVIDIFRGVKLEERVVVGKRNTGDGWEKRLICFYAAEERQR